MNKIILILCLCFAADSYAGFGGSRSGGFSGGRSYSSGSSFRSSSFGGSRSSGSSASISRPSAPRYISNTSTTRVIHDYNGGGGGMGSGGFLNGMLIGHMMSGNNGTNTVVVPAGGAIQSSANSGDISQGGYSVPVVVQEESHFWRNFFWITIILGIVSLIVIYIREECR